MKPELTRPSDDFEALVHRHLRADEIVREGGALADWLAPKMAAAEAYLRQLRSNTPA